MSISFNTSQFTNIPGIRERSYKKNTLDSIKTDLNILLYLYGGACNDYKHE